MHVVCLSVFAYRLVGKKAGAQNDEERRNGREARPDRHAAVMGLGTFSGYHRLPQLKHTY
jgi:hypothetical protein